MECQPIVLAEAGLLDQFLRFRVDGIRQNHQRHHRGHMLFMGFDLAQAIVPADFDLMCQRCGIQMIRQIKIYVLMIFNSAQNMLFGDQVVFIPQIINSTCRKFWISGFRFIRTAEMAFRRRNLITSPIFIQKKT